MVAKGDLLGFWPVLGRGHLEKFRAQVKNGKSQFPDARGPEIKKKVTTLSGMVVRKFFKFCVSTDQGREIAKYGFSRPFWPRAALGT